MLEAAFARRYPLDTPGDVAIRERGVELCRRHLQSGLADNNAEQRLCSENDHQFWQQLSEVLLADQLARVGIQPAHAGVGPDFLIEHEGQRIWIEVVCPEPRDVPREWLAPPDGSVRSLPHEAMLLRWTTAIKEKSEKLLGKLDEAAGGYLGKGVVAAEDAYVIAVNARLLRADWPNLEGISQFPFAVEATLCVGPFALTINRETLETIDAGHQHRPRIPKPNGAQIPADTFLDPRFKPISAIWAADIDENQMFERTGALAVVHNPEANNPIPLGLLPAQAEYLPVSQGDEYLLDRKPGRLAR